jgi:hypothetical protein
MIIDKMDMAVKTINRTGINKRTIPAFILI